MSERISRLSFLKHSWFVPAAVYGAKRLDPAGEPIPDGAPVIVVNAPHTTLSHLSINTDKGRPYAVKFNEGATNSSLRESMFWHQQ